MKASKMIKTAVGGPAIAAAVLGSAFVGGPSAGASAVGCTWAPGGGGANHCLGINGSGLKVNTVNETYTYGVGYANVCQYNAKWYGNKQSGGWTTYYGNYVSGCSVNVAWEGPYSINANFVNNSSFYGYWKSSQTGGNWTSPAALKIHS